MKARAGSDTGWKIGEVRMGPLDLRGCKVSSVALRENELRVSLRVARTGGRYDLILKGIIACKVPLIPIALACLLLAGPAAAAQAAPVSIPAIAQSADAGVDSTESEPGRQTTPGPEDEGYGPRMPRGEEAGSNAAIGSTLQGVYTFISVAGLVMLLLFAVSD